MSYKNIKRALKFQTNERLSGSSIDKIFKFFSCKFINIVTQYYDIQNTYYKL